MENTSSAVLHTVNPRLFPEQIDYIVNHADDEVVLRIDAAGICGSDMHAYLGHDERRPPPQILGHEAIGIATSGTPMR